MSVFTSLPAHPSRHHIHPINPRRVFIKFPETLLFVFGNGLGKLPRQVEQALATGIDDAAGVLCSICIFNRRRVHDHLWLFRYRFGRLRRRRFVGRHGRQRGPAFGR